MKRQIGRSRVRATKKHNRCARYRAKLKAKNNRRRMRVKRLLKK
ncbi:MAG: hypothetical protein QGH45_14380 [Myxococcota bacterium]|jgi:hypothetical protein|nr:hypothetical protein [Myxococcota bacterium]